MLNWNQVTSGTVMLFSYLLSLLDDLGIYWCGNTSPWCFHLLHFCSTRKFFLLQTDPPDISCPTTNQLNGLARTAKFYRLKSSSCPLLQAVEKTLKCDRVGNNSPLGVRPGCMRKWKMENHNENEKNWGKEPGYGVCVSMNKSGGRISTDQL